MAGFEGGGDAAGLNRATEVAQLTEEAIVAPEAIPEVLASI
jgi:hypothetical protein